VGLQNKGDYEQALLHYQRCIDNQERVKGKTTTAHRSVYKDKGDYNRHCCTTDSQRQTSDSQQHRFSLLHQRRLRTGTAALPKMLDNQERVKGKDAIDCASTLNNIGSVYNHKGDYEQALLHYQRCLTIQERVKGKDAIDCASTLSNIGSVY
jgi:tetratricopeptide (TPR) repeat protein